MIKTRRLKLKFWYEGEQVEISVPVSDREIFNNSRVYHARFYLKNALLHRSREASLDAQRNRVIPVDQDTADHLLERLTAIESFDKLVANKDYTPTLGGTFWEDVLANWIDRMFAMNGDPRRCFRRARFPWIDGQSRNAPEHLKKRRPTGPIRGHKSARLAAKSRGQHYGLKGDKGGWIRDDRGNTVCQGWYAYYDQNRHLVYQDPKSMKWFWTV